MFKWFKSLFEYDAYHIFDGEVRNTFVLVIKWMGIMVFIALYTVYAVATELILKPAVKFATGIVTALRD